MLLAVADWAGGPCVHSWRSTTSPPPAAPGTPTPASAPFLTAPGLSVVLVAAMGPAEGKT